MKYKCHNIFTVTHLQNLYPGQILANVKRARVLRATTPTVNIVRNIFLLHCCQCLK